MFYCEGQVYLYAESADGLVWYGLADDYINE